MKSKLEQHAEQLGALGHPARLSILRLLVRGGAGGTAAGELQTKLEIPGSTLSHHLDRLTSAGLVTSRRDGTFIYYAPSFDALEALTSYLWEDCCKGGKCCG
jgi:DNA-binding transcriptional ArsR family regulator